MRASDEGGESRRERRKREVHDRIVDAAVALFERQGFDTTTALEIAENADVAEKTFYNHFPTKQRLIEELARESLERLMEILQRAREAGGSPRERLLRFFASAAEEAEAGSRPLARELILEWIRISQVEEDRRLHEGFAALLADGDAGSREREFLADIAVATYTGILINWVSRSGYPLRERLLAAARLLGDAVPTKESR
jgi:AcrR family transcriptional regulator